ncbi:MAG: hypothetical protein N2321_00340 [Melioribacteraceae bacterium]|nr:hypothetical protein [Melioribacteraceae bacterium]
MKKLFIILFLINGVSFSQVKIGVDLYSRYLWRGLDFGNAPALQPSISYSINGLTFGAWGSYSFPTDGITYSENDLFLTYSYSSESSGTYSVTFTDYYIPSSGIPFGHFKSKNLGTAAHTLEGGLSYSGPEILPISISLFSNISNDPDNSTYIQLSYPFNIEETTITIISGFVTSKSNYYLTDKGNIINLSINVSKTINLTDKFSVPVNVSYISNPSQDITYLVFGLSLVF